MRNQNRRNPLDDDAWFVAEAVSRLLGGAPRCDDGIVSDYLPPMRRGELDPAHELREQVYRALDAGALPYLGKRKHGLVEPRAFIRWASSKKYEIPEALQFLLAPATSESSASGKIASSDDLLPPAKAESSGSGKITSSDDARARVSVRWHAKREADGEVMKDATPVIVRQSTGNSMTHVEIAAELLKVREYPPLDSKAVIKAVKLACYALDRGDLVKGKRTRD